MIFDMGRTMKLIDDKLYIADPQPLPVIPIGLDPDMPDGMMVLANREDYADLKVAMNAFVHTGDKEQYEREVKRLAPRIVIVTGIAQNVETKTDTEAADVDRTDSGSAEE